MDEDGENNSSKSSDVSDEGEMITPEESTPQSSRRLSQTQQSQNQNEQSQSKGDAKPETNGGEGAAASQSKRPKEQLDEVPLTISSVVSRDSKASLLVHLRDETLNFAGDTGAVGRIAVGSKKKGRGLVFDLKGRQFSGQIIPSATVLVVGVGRSEAKVEGVFSEVCRLDYMGNVFDSMGGEVLKGEMDASYRFEEEDVNARGGGVEEDGDGKGDGGKTPKLGRKTSFGRKRGGGAGSSSARKGGAKKSKKS
ncbi:unnamed protein product [Pylaiella littoralis]